MALLLPQDNYDTYLTAAIGSADSTIAVNVLPTQTAGVLSIFESDGVTLSEKIYYTGISAAAGSAGNLTGCVRGLTLIPVASLYPFTAVAANAATHAAGARIAMTDNVHYIGVALSVLNGDLEAGGVIQNPASRTINSSRDLCDKEYVDATAAAAGGLTAFYVTQNGADPSLTINVGSGYAVLGSTATSYAGASAQAVTNNATNYVQLTIAGALVINTTGFTDGNLPLAIVVASGGDITSITDARGWLTMALTPNQVAAIAGSLGTPSSTNKFVTAIDTSSGIDQSQTTRNASAAVGEADATTKYNKIAQSFTAGNINSTGVELNKQADTGTFTGDITISLQADSSGAPSGSALATVTITNAAWALQSAGNFLARWGTAYNAMTVGGTYWYVIQTTTSDNSNHPNLGTNSAGGYSGGAVKFNNTTDGWTSIATIDLYFRGLTTRADKVVRADSTGEVTGQLPYGVDAGSTDAYEWNFATDDTGYTDGKIYNVKFATLNTGACTGNVNGWGAKTIKKNHNLAPETGDIVANMQGSLQYNSTTDTLNLISPTNHEGLLSAARIANETGAQASYDLRSTQGTVPVVVTTEAFDVLGEMDNGYQTVTCTAGTNTTTVVASGATFTAADVGRYWCNLTRAGSAAIQLITALNSSTSITINSAVASQTSGDTGFVYSGKFTAAQTGIYSVNLVNCFTGLSATATYSLYIYKNGSLAAQTVVTGGTNGGEGQNVCIADLFQLTAGQTLQGFHAASGNIITGAGSNASTIFSVKRVS